MLKNISEQQVRVGLGRTLKSLRTLANMSQEGFAQLLSIHQTAVSRVESGSQSILPWQLLKVSEFFEISVDQLLSGNFDFRKIAERFGTLPPLPERYRQLEYSKIREALPALHFISSTQGSPFFEKMMQGFGMHQDFIGGPDQVIGVHFNLDVLRCMIDQRIINKNSLGQMIQYSRTEPVQGFLHNLYQTQESALSLIQSWFLNAHHYESNFMYAVQKCKKNSMEVSVKPAEHMREVGYKDETLGDFICEYKKQYLSSFPQYIGCNSVEVTEEECHFHGSSQCIYSIKIA